MKSKQRILAESLLENDLKWLVNEAVYLDMHKTKLGEDKDHIVLGFMVNDSKPAEDLAKFIEHGTSAFEDIEVSAAGDSAGRYFVYVEIARNSDAFETVNSILKDAGRLTGIEQWKFLISQDSEMDFNEENFAAHIVTDPVEYQRLHPATPSNGDDQQKTQESIKQRLGFLLNY